MSHYLPRTYDRTGPRHYLHISTPPRPDSKPDPESRRPTTTDQRLCNAEKRTSQEVKRMLSMQDKILRSI